MIRGKGDLMDKQKRIILALLSLAMFLVVLDSAIINVALPAIKSGLQFDGATLQWVLTSYVLTFGGFLMLGGRLADLYGRRRILVTGIVGFSVLSLLVGLAPSGVVLIALRALQGLAGALMAPAALSILLTTFAEGYERNRALSVWSMVASGGAAVGVFLGGLLTQYLGWRWNFFVNVPVGILAAIGVVKYIPAHTQEATDKRLDMPGAVLVTGGLMVVVYALSQASHTGWSNPVTLGCFVAGLVLLAVFLMNEARAKHPLVPLSIFRIRNVSGANLIMLPVVAGAFGMSYFASLYIQNVLHYSPLLTGLSFLPIPVIIGVISNYAPRLIERFGFKSLLVVGMTLVTVGVFILSFVSAQSTYVSVLLPAFVVMAFGIGLTFVAVTVAATSGVPGEEAGLASGLINTSQQIGGALGIAILAMVANASTAAALSAGKSLAMAGLIGYQRAFLCSALMMAAALVVAIAVIRAPDHTVKE
jgi:EmrB/QacA subfamily drug resistance transporter